MEQDFSSGGSCYHSSSEKRGTKWKYCVVIEDNFVITIPKDTYIPKVF